MRIGPAGTALVTYSAGISACEKGGQWPEALSLLREMGDVKLDPNVIPTTMPQSARAGKVGINSAPEAPDGSRRRPAAFGRLQEGLRRREDGLKTAQDGPRRPQRAPRRLKDCSRWPQDGPTWPQDGPRSPQDAPRGSQNVPKDESKIYDFL